MRDKAQNTDSGWDKFYNEFEVDCESEDIDFFEALAIWKMGLAAYNAGHENGAI